MQCASPKTNLIPTNHDFGVRRPDAAFLVLVFDGDIKEKTRRRTATLQSLALANDVRLMERSGHVECFAHGGIAADAPDL